MAVEGDAASAAIPKQVPSIIPFPEKLELTGNLAHNWKRFKRVWENYEVASGLNEMGNAKRAATFLTCVGPDEIEIYDSWQLPDEKKNDIGEILSKFQTYCVGETNETYERYTFNTRNQEPGETFDSYLKAIRTLAKTCNFGTLEDNLIRDRIVIGISDSATKKKLLRLIGMQLLNRKHCPCLSVDKIFAKISLSEVSFYTLKLVAISNFGKLEVFSPFPWNSRYRSMPVLNFFFYEFT